MPVWAGSASFPAPRSWRLLNPILAERDAVIELMHEYEAAVAALPRPANRLAIEAALEAGLPLVDLARPQDDWIPDLRREVADAGVLIVLGCGVEPGLTEIMTRHLAEKMDRVEGGPNIAAAAAFRKSRSHR